MTLFERQGLTVDEATLVFNTRGRPADGQLTVLLHSNTKRERQVPTDFPSSPTVAPRRHRTTEAKTEWRHLHIRYRGVHYGLNRPKGGNRNIYKEKHPVGHK